LHHGAVVRLTVNLEEDLYSLAKSLAIAEDCSISMAINKLLRVGAYPEQRINKRKKGFPVVRGRRRFTSEEVYKIEQL
jgi:hypothetical protein